MNDAETLYAWECPECGLDWREDKAFATTQARCGLCAGDTGHDVAIRR